MIPKPIYEVLPFLYLYIGLMAAFSTSPTFGRAAGVVLAVIGVFILKWRWKNRRS